MKYLILFILLVVVYLLQVSVVPNFEISHIYPNIILIITVIYLLNSKFQEALIFASIGGIMLDISSNIRFGIFTFDLLMLYFIFYFFVKKYISEPIFAIIFLVFIISSALFELPTYLFIAKNNLLYLYTIIYDTFLGILLYYLSMIVFTKKSKTYYILDK